ncbi:iron ABC transporter permease [Streptomyces sp. NBC_01340]|uniref:FecCD family ABC transporter permease n=1 Tax=unclassified Streptomyces TaxID=2593676 RepID=UPI0022511C25|nr:MULTISPECIES: iron chelate uptake ABC transporter family permease subunit [unclassified Streptomyces]MCX4452421.1 iron ABC transporter permease [Streptomyces sp. NBC_01719]MCX4491781.1 iron ABC transporter permease [Streptomyces sp. NBC_01728]WSI36979.1 iron ABC transporter permease [Streptomyces sp. NBC_01340]
MSTRLLLMTGGGLVALLASVAVAVTIGPADISTGDVWASVAAHLGFGDSTLAPLRDGIVWNLRMPRTLLAAVCGAVMQSLLRNPLADPFVLGVSSGAATRAVAVVVLGVGGGVVSVSAGAFLGALLSFVLVLLLSHILGDSVDRVVLSGVAAMQMFSALTSFIVLTSADAETTRGVLFWMLGSLTGADRDQVLLCTVALAVVLLVCLGHARTLDAFAFGEETAASLGVRVARTRLILLCVTALLTAALVSCAGAIGFVGLVLPHATRALTGSGHARLLPVTALTGAVFMVWVDTVARTVLDPQEVPVGVVTSLIGVPAFVAVLYRGRRRV